MTARVDPAGAHELDRRGATPLWVQLLADLRRRLGAGEFSDAFPGGAVDALSYTAVLFEIGGALALGAAGLYALRRDGRC